MGNQAVGGPGGIGGRGGTAGFGGSVSGLPIGDVAGHCGTGENGGSGYGGGINAASGTVVLLADTLNANIAQGGRGGSGPVAVVFGGTGIQTGTGGTGTGGGGGGGGGGGSAANSAGAGGSGGNGATGEGGGLYVSGGTLTLTNDTIAADSAQAGSSGSSGKGGHAGTGNVTGGPGIAGAPGESFGGGLYVNSGVVNLFNTTIALNIQNGSGTGGGVAQAAGTVTAVSTLFAEDGPVDYSGDVNATDCLFQTAPTGTLSGTGNLVGVDPLLDPKGLQNNGGPTQTIALQAFSKAIGAGANPENLFTDQRGYAPRTGPHGTDIGAYQYNSPADTQAPTATLQAVAVTDANAASLNPYTFTITFSDDVAIAAASLPGSVVDVIAPGQAAPISTTVVNTTPLGATDANGNAQAFVVTYQITPPGGSWTSADGGTYTITLGGAPVTDLAGNAVALGNVGTFSVLVGTSTASVVVGSTLPGSTYGQSVSFTVTVSGGGPTPQGTVQFLVDGSNFGSPVTLSGGNATSASTTLLGAGSHPVLAQYSGDASYAANTGTYTQIVNQASLTLVADDQSMNHYDAVPALTDHCSGFLNGDNATSSGITASVSLSTTATSTSPAGYYPIHPTVNSFSAPNYTLGGTQDGTLTVKPKVMDVRVDFGVLSMSLIDLNRDLPFINIKALDVIFSDNVIVSKSMLQLLGVNVKNYSLSGFSYNSSNFDATWSFSSAIGVDRLMLSLNGEAAPPESGSGPNIGADPFSNKFAVLPGDVDGDGVVSGADVILVRNEILAGKYLIWDDVDGNGVVDITDYINVRKRLGSHLT